MGPEATPGMSQVDPKFQEFFQAATGVLREMSMRQVLLLMRPMTTSQLLRCLIRVFSCNMVVKCHIGVRYPRSGLKPQNGGALRARAGLGGWLCPWRTSGL